MSSDNYHVECVAGSFVLNRVIESIVCPDARKVPKGCDYKTRMSWLHDPIVVSCRSPQSLISALHDLYDEIRTEFLEGRWPQVMSYMEKVYGVKDCEDQIREFFTVAGSKLVIDGS